VNAGLAAPVVGLGRRAEGQRDSMARRPGLPRLSGGTERPASRIDHRDRDAGRRPGQRHEGL